MIKTIIIDEKSDQTTVRDFLRRELKLSSGMTKRLKFRDGGITVNGNHVTVRYVLKAGDTLVLKDQDTQEDTCPYMIPVDLDIGIIYEDSHVCAVDKPPDMPAHPSQSHRLDTVANALAYRYSGEPYVFRPVNRLDRDTSGLMLTANTRFAASELYRQMVEGNIIKLYMAVLTKQPDPTSGIISKYMKRLEGSVIERRCAEPCEDGAKSALTLYKVLCTDEATGRCCVLCAPITGRTHQLRVHFSSIGCTICGDTLYGADGTDIPRQALHAAYLSFQHPESKESIRLFSPLPDDIRSLLGDGMSKNAESLFQASITDELTAHIKKLKSDI